MRSSRLNILAAELFSLVTEVKTETGWSQLLFQPGVSRSGKQGNSIFSWSERWEGCCGAHPQHPDWPHRVNACPHPEAAQLSCDELLQLTSCPQSKKRPCRNHSSANRIYLLPSVPAHVVITLKGPGSLMLPCWKSPVMLLSSTPK